MIERQPARVYDLNYTASILGRTQTQDLSDRSQKDIRLHADAAISILEDRSRPPAVHNQGEMITQAISFSNKLQVMLDSSGEAITASQRRKIREVLIDFESDCDSLRSSKFDLIVPLDEVESMFQFYGIWDSGDEQLHDDLERWNSQTLHPRIPNELEVKVNLDQTKDLIEVMKSDVLGIDEPFLASIYLTSDPSNYHLFWSLTEDSIDYATPDSYDLATQLSFDLPHNVTHLVHLHKIRTQGVGGYVDDMATRAFFEALAVHSEYEIVNMLQNNPSTSYRIHDQLRNPQSLTPKELSEWIVADRTYEFRLRGARLLSDLLTVKGMPYDDVVETVKSTIQISKEDAQGEVNKYLPWTGLGAIYTLGYRRIQKNGFNSVREVLKLEPTPKKWSDLTSS